MSKPQGQEGVSVSCPHCGAKVEWVAQSLHRPFCSERCRLIDLGGWASEAYALHEPSAGLDEEPDHTSATKGVFQEETW